MPWNAHQLFVIRPTQSRDATVRSCGIHGNILGSRIDLLIMDDILDYENTLSPTQREDLWGWYRSTLETRLTRRARALCIGTAWHREDLMHRLARTPGWHPVSYPVLDDDGNPRWPERWPLSRINEARIRMGTTEFARNLLCKARNDSDERFQLSWIELCKARGEGREMPHALMEVPNGYATYTGVDLGVRTNKKADLTVLFTICLHPDGSREVLDIQSGRWAGPEIVRRIIDTHRRYLSIVLVENNAAQEFILQFTRASSAVPVRPFTTGANKAHPEFGIEGIAVEMQAGKWIIPSDNGHCVPEVEAWINEMLYYDPRTHSGDRLMGSWFAREGARGSGIIIPKAQFGSINLLSR